MSPGADSLSWGGQHTATLSFGLHEMQYNGQPDPACTPQQSYLRSVQL
jgi:hypothetical protein